MENVSQKKKDFSRKLKEKAIYEGFAVSGISSIPGGSRIKLRTDALERWLSNNYHGEMAWMEANKRKDIRLLLKGAKSVLSVGFNYLSEEKETNSKFKVAKFGQGEDYHKVIYKKLKKIGKWINNELPECRWKICVDTSPLLEKAWAEESGIGWIGKNSNLINKNYGSWLTLGFMILSIDLIPDHPSQPFCGKCEKCIEKCPTSAITEPFVIDSNLCIAYHTIENRKKILPQKIEENLNGWIAGCDICQDICPWNKAVPFNTTFETKTKKWITNLNDKALNWEDKEWEINLKGTTFKRIKPWMWKRNIKAILKNN